MRAIINIRLEKGGEFYCSLIMVAKRFSKNRLVKAIFGCLFVMMGLFTAVAPAMVSEPVFADPVEETTETTEATETTEQATISISDELVRETQEGGKSCQDSLGAIGWLVCPTTGKISEAVDWLYDKIENILVINPVEMKDGSPIYEIWKYMLGVTNVVFIIFCLVMVYSQLTGLGITNYGLKKTLPKLIVAAILVNLSFLICSLAVDASNIIGSSLRGVFTSIEEATMGGMTMTGGLKVSEMYSALAGGSTLAIGAGLIAFETGAIWMLIPTVLGAIVAVVVGLVTIALRQAVVALLIMISPLAIVAYMLPNTEQWFKKWRQLLTKMLVFYPMFSLLFGASSLAGFAIIASAQDGFGLLLGIAVQIFPLFFSWSLMKMSGTVLGTINSKLSGLMARPLMANRAWADSHRELTRQRNLARGNVYLPSLKLVQFLNNRKVAREEETKEHAESVRLRGQAYAVMRNYTKDGKYLSKEGEESFEQMIRNVGYQRTIDRHKHTFNGGVGDLGANKAQTARLKALDAKIIRESDRAKMETTRGELIDYRNAVGFHERMEDAMLAHEDEKYGYEIDKNGNRVRRGDYKFHFDGEKAKDLADATARYSDISKIMKGNEYDAQYAAAAAAHARDSQQKVHDTRMQKYAELLPPTRDVEYRLKELIDTVDKIDNTSDAIKNVDAIISFMRVLNQRGDTDLLTNGMFELMKHDVNLGTHASQALAGFSMFEVKGADPAIRRFGKYINLETAQMYNKNKRKNPIVHFKEYVTGQYEEEDPENAGQTIIRYSKRPMAVLMEGTSFDDIERTAMSNMDDLIKSAYRDKDGKLDIKKFFAKRDQIETAIGPQFISSSLKQLSGSEQLKSLVTFKTGYAAEVAKEVDQNGKERVIVDENGDPIYEWKAVWDKDDSDFIEDPKYARKYYQEHTMKYLSDQTPNQILRLRSDYYDGLREHLAERFEEYEDSDLTAEELQARRDYEAERARIQTKYGDAPIGEAKRKRDAELKAAKHKIAGIPLRKMLDGRGTLEQIYRMRRSGIAADAKPWVREWLKLDDEVAIRIYEEAKRKESRERKAELEKKIEEAKGKLDKEVESVPKVEDSELEEGASEEDLKGDDEGAAYESPLIYDESYKQELIDAISELYEDLRDDDESFYEESLSYLKSKLAKDSFVIVEYEKNHENDPYAGTYEMRNWLLDLLDDIRNY